MKLFKIVDIQCKINKLMKYQDRIFFIIYNIPKLFKSSTYRFMVSGH